MRPSRVKSKLKRGEPVLITCCHFIDPSLYELVSLLGFDGIWLDLEHHSTSDETASNLMRTARIHLRQSARRRSGPTYGKPVMTLLHLIADAEIFSFNDLRRRTRSPRFAYACG